MRERKKKVKRKWDKMFIYVGFTRCYLYGRSSTLKNVKLQCLSCKVNVFIGLSENIGFLNLNLFYSVCLNIQLKLKLTIRFVSSHC